jgi:hypothetical protein
MRDRFWAGVGCVTMVAISLTCAAPESPPGPAPVPPAALASRPPASSRKPLPRPVTMPGGGQRIDLRDRTDNVRVLELRPDGTYAHACTDAPEIKGGAR